MSESAENAPIGPKSLVARLDELIFIKGGYSFWTHLVPFSIAALLLLTLSAPTDNLLLKLVGLLQRPSWIWLPAGLLTGVATALYIVTINVQVRQAYLWPDGDLRRTITTSLTYIILCALMAYAVLKSVPSRATTFGDIWACLLLAVLSLTGIGWSGPGSWVESIGIRSPDYADGRLSAAKLTEILQRVRGKARGEKEDVDDFLEAAKNLRSSIETNLTVEPEWATDKLRRVSDALRNLADQAQKQFASENGSAARDFAAACNGQQEFYYGDFIRKLQALANYWPEWQCPKAKERRS